MLKKFKEFHALVESHTCKKLKPVSYASFVGSLKYAMACTIPNIVHDVGTISIFLSKSK